MASSGDVEVAPEPGVEVEQQAAEACDGGSGLAANTTEESEAVLLQEQHDTAPEPDHHEEAASEQAAEVSQLEEPGEGMKPPVAKEEGEPKASGGDDQESTRERLKRHRLEMAGRVWVPEMWGQEKLLKDWVDCAVFDSALVPTGLLTARRELIAECCTRRPDRTSTAARPAPALCGCRTAAPDS